jgi:hypothetical protein
LPLQLCAKEIKRKGEELSGNGYMAWWFVNGYMAWWFVNVGITAGNLYKKDRSLQACSECITDLLVPTL